MKMLFMLILLWEALVIQGKSHNNGPHRIYVDSGNQVFILNQFDRECVILSSKYKNGYFHAADYVYSDKPMNRPALVYMPIFGSKRPDEFKDEDRKGVWILTPVGDGKSGVFFIKNARYGEYLYSFDYSWRLTEMLENRRPVYTNRFLNQVYMDQSYMWQFKKQEDGTYQIWNVRFNERKYNFYFILLVFWLNQA
jgi:hypothetical protein